MAARAFVVTELRRVAAGGRVSLQPTGVSFTWTRETFSAPRGPWEFGVAQRTVRDDYPGSEEPVEQVLGWNHEAFSIEGEWDDRYGGSGFALKTWQDFEALTKRGNFVRLEFEAVSVTGLIVGAKFRYTHRGRIAYSCQFSPHFRTPKETVRAVVAGPRSTLDPKTVAQRARAQLDALRAAQARATAANLSQVQGALTDGDLFAAINGDLDLVDAALGKIEAGIDAPVAAAESAGNVFLRAVQILAGVKTIVAATLARLQSLASTTSLGLTTASAVLDFESWRRDVAARLRDLVVGATDAQRELRPRAQTGVKRLHRARAGESLYAISNHYYGTPHRWREVLERNGLTSVVLAGGELLVIGE